MTITTINRGPFPWRRSRSKPAIRDPHTPSAEPQATNLRTILGIDPGLERTGYAVLRMPGPSILDAGLIRTNVNLALPRRLVDLATGLDEVLDEHNVHLVAVEDLYAHYKHPRTAILMGHARGIVLLAAAQHGLDVLSLPATRIKKTLTGNGHASKPQMQRAIAATFKLKKPPEPPDVADALAIAWCAGMLHSAIASIAR